MANQCGIRGKILSEVNVYQKNDVKSAKSLDSLFQTIKCEESIAISAMMWSEVHLFCEKKTTANVHQSLNPYYIGNGPDDEEEDDDEDDDDFDDEDDDDDDLDGDEDGDEDDSDFEEDDDDD